MSDDVMSAGEPRSRDGDRRSWLALVLFTVSLVAFVIPIPFVLVAIASSKYGIPTGAALPALAWGSLVYMPIAMTGLILGISRFRRRRNPAQELIALWGNGLVTAFALAQLVVGSSLYLGLVLGRLN